MTEWQNNLASFTLLNGPAGDSAVHVQFPQTGCKVLFDLGSLEHLTYGELLEISHAFVSHTHFDHFVGFDALLRATFPLERPLEISGPTGITRNVRGKLNGYCWNLVQAGQVNVLVREIVASGKVETSKITNQPDGFVVLPIENVETPFSDSINPPLFTEPDCPIAFVTNLKGNIRVFAVCLDHCGTNSIAYCFVTPRTLQMKKERFSELNLKPDRWVGEFQKAYLNGETAPLTIDGAEYSMQTLTEKLLEIKSAFKFAYLTDFGFTPSNLSRVRPFVAGCDYVMIESNYREPEAQMALEKGHLTTRQSALLAAYSGASAYSNFHFSCSYDGEEAQMQTEAQEFFQNFRTLPHEKLMENVLE